MATSPLIMVRFEKLKNSLVAGNKPVLQDGRAPLSARPQAYLSASGGRTGSIWNTEPRPFLRIIYPYMTGGNHKVYTRTHPYNILRTCPTATFNYVALNLHVMCCTSKRHTD